LWHKENKYCNQSVLLHFDYSLAKTLVNVSELKRPLGRKNQLVEQSFDFQPFYSFFSAYFPSGIQCKGRENIIVRNRVVGQSIIGKYTVFLFGQYDLEAHK